MDGFQDVLYGLRMMRRRPGFTAAIAVTLALGIGANAAVFSIVEAVLLQPLPYKDPSRLVAIWDKDVRAAGISKMFDSFEDFRQISQHTNSFEQVAAATWAVNGRLLSGHGATRSVLAMPVSESFFPLLGIAPARGRTFEREDLKRDCSVVLSDHLWRGALAADPKLIGNSIQLDNQACTVVGVMPADFAFYPDATALWVLLTPNYSPSPDQLPVGIFARLKPGVNLAQAQPEISRLHSVVHRRDGKERNIVPVVYGLQQEFTFLAETDLKTTLWVLLGAVSFVLLIACVNVANLLLGQALGREREFAVRTALGGGRRRLIRQLLTEGLLLACIGGGLGLGVAFSAVHYFRSANPIEMPIGAHVAIDWRVLAFTAAISVITALLFGLLPAWKASRVDAIEGLKAAGRGSASGISQRLAKGLIAAEIALSLVLLAGAGLLMRSVLNMGSEPLGFHPEGLAVTDIVLPANSYPDSARRLQFYDRLVSRLGDRAAIATSLPPYNGGASALHIADKPISKEVERHDVGRRTVTPGYFDVLGVRLLRGRAFERRDRASSEKVALINEAIAQEYFGGSDPIGQRICAGDPSDKNPWRTIVGVVANEKGTANYHQIGWMVRAQVFEPLSQNPPYSASIVTRGGAADLRRVVTDTDSGVAIGDTGSMQTRLGRMMAYPWFRAILLSAFAVFSVFLAGIGLHGVLRQFVTRRTQEIGIRMALGATPADVLRLILLQAGRPVGLGLAAGLLGTVAVGRYLGSLLYGVEASDGMNFAIVCVLLVCVAGLAMLVPARRATRVEPMAALRDE